MPINMLSESPIIFALWALAIILGITVHEFSHALAGKLLGDNTADDAGRLTLNPLAHIDIMGFIMLLLIGFGWGKPTPFNPYNLKYQKFGPTMVGLAGPLSNFLIVLLCTFFIKMLSGYLTSNNLLVIFLHLSLLINLALMIFNLIPIPPLDGSSIVLTLLPYKFQNIKNFLETQGPIILIGLVLADSFLGLNFFSSIITFFSRHVTNWLM